MSATMPQNWFNYIEHKLFQNNKLGQPNPSMRIKFVVTYTSPMGRNSYSRCLVLSGVDEISQTIVNMNQRIQKKSAEAFQRERERSKMSLDVRHRVLERDGRGCKYCGRGSDVVTLHVDHIRPISKGGRTELNNLQTLCADCNLGKSNKW
ncbi:MAG: HNH endonuclease [Acidimicrobiales bacterium]|nr:HNH endonuclease [Acidimicrobiales bacterium]